MYDVEATFSHIMAEKLRDIKKTSEMTLQELENKTGYPNSNISATFKKNRKGSPEFFEKIGIALGIPETRMKSMILESMMEAIKAESNPKEFKVAFKNFTGSSAEMRDLARAVLAVDEADK